MNERINELAFDAGFIIKKNNGAEWRWGYIDPELAEKLDKFAELIVRDVVETVKRTQETSPDFEWVILNNYNLGVTE